VRKTNSSQGVLLLACLLLAVSGCRPAREPVQPEPVTPRPGGTLQLWIPAADILDPLFFDDVYEATVGDNLYDGLVSLDDNLAVIPDLAEEWKVSRDGRVYDFKIRSGVRFHDGSPLEIEDILFTFRRAMTLQSPVSVDEVLRRLVDDEFRGGVRHPRIYALDASTVRIVLRQPYPEFLKIVAMDQLQILPRRYFPANRRKIEPPFVGTGPFVLKERTPERVVIRRNKSYFLRPAYIDQVQFTLIPDLKPAQKVELFRNGRLDVMEAVNIPHPEQIVPLNHWIVKAELSTSFLVFNCSRPPTDNIFFRKAFIAAFDRQRFLSREFRGVKPTESILPPGMPGYQPISGRYRYNPNAAVVLLESSALAPDKLPLLDVLMASDDPDVAACFRQAGTVLGVRMQLRHVADWTEFTRQMDNGEYHVTQLVWTADTPIPEQFYQSLLSSKSSQNVARFKDEKIDSLIFRMYSEQNLNEKLNIIKTIEARVSEQAPYMPVENYIMNFIIHPRVQHARMSPFGLLSLNTRDLWIKESEKRR
jgi:ABC-type transport system substrate-binding protein